ncbi:MAG: hypothetical protein QW379_04185 [Thermoplasmata archaeon]
MRKYFGAAAALTFFLCLILAFFGGSRNIFESPISSLPSLLIDHYDNQTEVYVHGLNEFRYTNMTVWVSDGTTEFMRYRENTYFIYLNTTLTNFTLNVTVWNKKKAYVFQADIRVADPEEFPAHLFIYEKEDGDGTMHVLQKSNLPWKKVMERVK